MVENLPIMFQKNTSKLPNYTSHKVQRLRTSAPPQCVQTFLNFFAVFCKAVEIRENYLVINCWSWPPPIAERSIDMALCRTYGLPDARFRQVLRHGNLLGLLVLRELASGWMADEPDGWPDGRPAMVILYSDFGLATATNGRSKTF
jgi:hypothetical protein